MRDERTSPARLLVLAAERTQGVIVMRKMALVFQAQVLERPFFDRPGCQAGGVEPDQDIALFRKRRLRPIVFLIAAVRSAAGMSCCELTGESRTRSL